jgi:hypothetical protein
MRGNSIIRTDVERICNAVDLRSLSKKTILVSGASGLIGTYVLSCLNWLQEWGLDIQVYGLVFFEDSRISERNGTTWEVCRPKGGPCR